MSGWWWVALFAVVVAGLVASIVDGRARAAGGRRRRGAARNASDEAPSGESGSPRAGVRTGAPARAGEVWRARVGRGGGSRERLCLVLRVGPGGIRVVPIVARPDARRPEPYGEGGGQEAQGPDPYEEGRDRIPLPPGALGEAGHGEAGSGEAGSGEREGFLETDALGEIGPADLVAYVGELDPAAWGRVRHLAD